MGTPLGFLCLFVTRDQLFSDDVARAGFNLGLVCWGVATAMAWSKGPRWSAWVFGVLVVLQAAFGPGERHAGDTLSRLVTLGLSLFMVFAAFVAPHLRRPGGGGSAPTVAPTA